jgi:hypothetical protein
LIILKYDEFCHRCELGIRLLVEKEIPFQIEKITEKEQQECRIYDGPVFYEDKNIIGTLDDLKFVLKSNEKALAKRA